MEIKLMTEEKWYDVEHEGNNYSLQEHLDHNNGWSEISIYDEDGNDVDEQLKVKILEKFESNEKV